MHRYLPAIASQLGARVAEVVVNHRPRRFGRSKYGLSRTFRVIADLVHLRGLMRRGGRSAGAAGRRLYEIAEVPRGRINAEAPCYTWAATDVHWPNVATAVRSKPAIAKKTTKAITDFNLIEDGDRIMVGLSGGKDSWALMQTLDNLRQRAPIDFSLDRRQRRLRLQGLQARRHRQDLRGARLGVPHRAHRRSAR